MYGKGQRDEVDGKGKRRETVIRESRFWMAEGPLEDETFEYLPSGFARLSKGRHTQANSRAGGTGCGWFREVCSLYATPRRNFL